MVRQVEDTIQRIRTSLTEMWILVQGQVEKAADALINNNREAALEVRNREKMVDSYELLIDKECENFFALLNPVAVDMRLIISILKMNNDLERIGDFANSIAKTVIDGHRDKIAIELLTTLELRTMFDEVETMLSLCRQSFINEDSTLTGKVFSLDDNVDTINYNAIKILSEYMKERPEQIYDCILLSASIRRIERIGDRCSNIAEDIVFYLEAKVLKHIKNTLK